jgi:hypothetical protein
VDRPDEANRAPDPPSTADRPPPWEEPSGVIERLITAQRWAEAERRGETVEPPGTPREVNLLDHPPEHHDVYDNTMGPTRRADVLREGPDGPRPLFDGPPDRSQVAQGRLGDCGVMATMSAVAAHRPDVVERCVRESGEGYEVELHRVERRGDMYEASGETIRLQVPSDLPVFEEAPDRPAFAQVPEAAWPAVLEQAIAGLDQARTPEQRAEWDATWNRIKQARNADREATGEPPLPDGPTPTGYARLNQGTTPREQAELLSQLTGESSEVRRFPTGQSGDIELASDLRRQLDENKPVIVGTRSLKPEEHELPSRLVPTHVYEVTSVEDGKVHLHNPWGFRHPEPVTVAEFREFFSREVRGHRNGTYTTLH